MRQSEIKQGPLCHLLGPKHVSQIPTAMRVVATEKSLSTMNSSLLTALSLLSKARQKGLRMATIWRENDLGATSPVKKATLLFSSCRRRFDWSCGDLDGWRKAAAPPLPARAKINDESFILMIRREGEGVVNAVYRVLIGQLLLDHGYLLDGNRQQNKNGGLFSWCGAAGDRALVVELVWFYVRAENECLLQEASLATLSLLVQFASKRKWEMREESWFVGWMK